MIIPQPVMIDSLGADVKFVNSFVKAALYHVPLVNTNVLLRHAVAGQGAILSARAIANSLSVLHSSGGSVRVYNEYVCIHFTEQVFIVSQLKMMFSGCYAYLRIIVAPVFGTLNFWLRRA